MMPNGFDRRDAMLVLSALSRVGSVSTSEGASRKVSTPEVMDTLMRMGRPEDFWDLVFQYVDDRILELHKTSRGEARFSVVDVQAHDVSVYLHQNREELESYEMVSEDEDELTRLYLEGLSEARARAVFY